MNVLAIGAHPDDLEVSCGGTLARYAQRGDRVFSCVVTDGRAHPVGDPQRISTLRRSEASAAAQIIGAELIWMGIPDGELIEDVPTRHRFVDAILSASPDIIITHTPEDYHSDHVTTSRLVMAAVQMAWAPPPSIAKSPLRKQVPVAFMQSAYGINFLPEDYVDITEVWDTKLEMVSQHRTQYLPGPEYGPEQVKEPLEQYFLFRLSRIPAEFYGLQCWRQFAEPFRWWRAADRVVPARLLP